MRQYCILGEGFGWHWHNAHHIEWIYWVAGTQTVEQLLSWKEMGINPRKHNNVYFSEYELHPLVWEKGLPLMKAVIAKKYKKDTAKELLVVISNTLAENASKAVLLSKLPIDVLSPLEICNIFRHQCTPYDAHLKQGKDRYIETLKSCNDLIEIMQCVASFKDEILKDHETEWDYLRDYKRLAVLNHEQIIKECLSLIEQRKSAEV